VQVWVWHGVVLTGRGPPVSDLERRGEGVARGDCQARSGSQWRGGGKGRGSR
jgi:hypothetical protein